MRRHAALLATGFATIALAAPTTAADAPSSSPGGCSFRVGAAPTDPHHLGRSASSRWRLTGSARCAVAETELRLSVDLTRNGVAVPGSGGKAACTLGELHLCSDLSVGSRSARMDLRGRWQPRLVAFLRGPTSTLQWSQDGTCVLDIPSFITICTIVGDVVTIS